MKNSVRISAGEFKGRFIACHPSPELRPTLERVRESFFNIVNTQIRSAVFIDAFAGSGIMGFEALSLGAKLSVFIDRSFQACQTILQNQKKLSIPQTRVVVKKGDTLSVLAKMINMFPPDLVFLDPPYSPEIGELSLKVVSSCELRDQTVVVLEHHHKFDPDCSSGNLHKVRRERYGESCLTFFQTR